MTWCVVGTTFIGEFSKVIAIDIHRITRSCLIIRIFRALNISDTKTIPYIFRIKYFIAISIFRSFDYECSSGKNCEKFIVFFQKFLTIVAGGKDITPCTLKFFFRNWLIEDIVVFIFESNTADTITHIFTIGDIHTEFCIRNIV